MALKIIVSINMLNNHFFYKNVIRYILLSNFKQKIFNLSSYKGEM